MIIEVDGGRFEKLDIVTRDVKKKGIEHPVLWDAQCKNTETYGVNAWPVAYLIGVNGKVIWEGNPARVIGRRRSYERLVALLESELKKVKPTTKKDVSEVADVAN